MAQRTVNGQLIITDGKGNITYPPRPELKYHPQVKPILDSEIRGAGGETVPTTYSGSGTGGGVGPVYSGFIVISALVGAILGGVTGFKTSGVPGAVMGSVFGVFGGLLFAFVGVWLALILGVLMLVAWIVKHIGF
jgi:hypothetical protein